ncbi:hypothetical protein FCG19_22055 [Xanthomonas hortorum pv. vitians]|nr:hypothetical protein [Xanthomonas hortorum pv. vitians]NMI37260.1 hypothetical protein [Xanthomonas hortorum pv. vitians]
MTNKQGRVLIINVPALVPTTVSLKDKDLLVGVEIGEMEKRSVAPRQGGVRVTLPVLTQNAKGFVLDGAPIPPVIASTPNEKAMVGYDGLLHLEHPDPGMEVQVLGVCRAVLHSPPPGAGKVKTVLCQ